MLHVHPYLSTTTTAAAAVSVNLPPPLGHGTKICPPGI